MDDDAIMLQAVRGDKAAFGRIVKDYGPRMARFAFRMIGDRDAAVDVVQDAFVKLWQSRAHYTPSGAVDSYLFQIVRNACIDYIRANRRWVQVRLEDDADVLATSCESAVMSSVLSDAVAAALLELPELQRVVFVLNEYEGLTYDEIADVLGCPKGTVASRKYAAVDALRKRLQPMVDGRDE